MKRHGPLGWVRLPGGLFALVVPLACASTPPAVPIEGTPAELSALAGHWEGEYSSQATGRLGSIAFDLTAGEDHAHGDVLMIRRGSNRPYGRAPRERERGEGSGARSRLAWRAERRWRSQIPRKRARRG